MCGSGRYFRWFALGLERLLESTQAVNWCVLGAGPATRKLAHCPTILGHQLLASLDLPFLTPQTQFMPHTYLLFDFATDEEKAQLARHKLETWKQAFRLDKKLLYKFDRVTSGDGAEPSVEEKPAKPAKEAKAKGVAKSKSKSEAKSGNAEPDTPDTKEATLAEPVKLLIRLDFSSHEKLSEQRWVDRIPTEDPFQAASPRVIKPNDTEFADTEKQFEDLA
jgi:hypothetical protein